MNDLGILFSGGMVAGFLIGLTAESVASVFRFFRKLAVGDR